MITTTTITLSTIQIIILVILWTLSIFVAHKFSQYRCKIQLKALKAMSIKLKVTIEEAIKDKIIDEEESIELRDAVIDLEEKLD